MDSSRSFKTAILGFGNPVRSDDAVGVYVVNELKKYFTDRKDISIFDMGTSAFEVLFKLAGHDRIIIVDAVLNSGSADGTLFLLPASEINESIQDDPLVFLHGMKWDQALSYSKKIMGDKFPENIQVYLVAITETKLDMEMSEVVKNAGNKLVTTIVTDLAEHTLNIPKEAIAPKKGFSWDSEVYLESAHICIKKDVAEKVFGSESTVLSVFYAHENSFMVAPAGEELFRTIHKGSQQMLKSKNQAGDKSIAIHELLLDHEVDPSDRDLAYDMEEALHTLTVRL